MLKILSPLPSLRTTKAAEVAPGHSGPQPIGNNRRSDVFAGDGPGLSKFLIQRINYGVIGVVRTGDVDVKADSFMIIQ